MTDTSLHQFGNELKSFFRLVLLNMVFGAMAMGFGMQFCIASILGLPIPGLPDGQSLPALRILGGAIALAGFGLGFSWVLASARILKGVKGIRREFRARNDPVPPEIITGWIVRLLAHYRENKKTLSRMIVICRLGGCVFVTLGVLNLLQAFTAGPLGDGVFLAASFMAAAMNLTIGMVTIMISIGFHRYSIAWDRRLDETARNERLLKQELETGLENR